MRFRSIARAAFLSIALAAFAQAQFQLAANQSGTLTTLQSGGTLTFAAPVGQTQSAQLTATFTGSGQATISSQPTITGSSAFKATLTGTLPLTLNPGDSFSIAIQFVPTSGTTSTAQLLEGYSQSVPSGSAAAPTVTTGSFTVVLAGTAPSFTESYTLQTDQNAVALQSGGTILFPPTTIGTTAQAALTILNSGSGPGSITGITPSGSAFQLSNVPLIPATVPAGQPLTVQVLYKPTAVATDTGQIVITFSSGSPVTINLQGSGSAASFTYQIVGNPPVTVTPGGTITLPSTNVGTTSSVVVRVLNSGNASGTVSLVNPAGAAFTVSALLPLPQTLAPGGSLTFTVTFSPTQPGTFTGALIVNSDTFTLTGVGLGSQLQFSYSAGGATVTLTTANNTVVFSPTTITQSEQLTFDVKNTGTLPATLSNIGIGQNPSPFSLNGLPSLPVSLAPGADFQFPITFTPTALGFSTGTLMLDATSVTLSGSGTQPPPLPAYTISGPTGTATPMSQPTVGLTLASPYPVAVSGTLSLSIAGNLPADPSAQFATGGRTIAFVIPANQTSAVFGAQGTQVGVQTGTVAGAFTLTPAFATQNGNVDLTPTTPTTLQFSVASGAPTLLAVQVVNPAVTGFSVQITGFTPTRTLSAMSVQLTVAPGYKMAVTQFTFNIQSISTVWFASTASQAFGGQFTITVPFSFLGTVPAGQTLLTSIASVSVTMTNATGTSSSIAATLQ